MMKYRQHITLLLLALLSTWKGFGQVANWTRLTPDDKHLVAVNLGWDYGTTIGISYAYQLKTERPLLLVADLSVPFGEKLLDDFKMKIGGEMRLFRLRSWHASVSAQSIYRRYENELVRLQNFGAELGAKLGYYRPHWFLAGQAGFDKAIVTHFKHSDLYEEQLTAVPNGWYEPATGGNFSFGLQGGYSLQQLDITFGLGLVKTQDLSTTPLIPYYAEIGFAYRWD